MNHGPRRGQRAQHESNEGKIESPMDVSAQGEGKQMESPMDFSKTFINDDPYAKAWKASDDPYAKAWKANDDPYAKAWKACKAKWRVPWTSRNGEGKYTQSPMDVWTTSCTKTPLDRSLVRELSASAPITAHVMTSITRPLLTS